MNIYSTFVSTSHKCTICLMFLRRFNLILCSRISCVWLVNVVSIVFAASFIIVIALCRFVLCTAAYVACECIGFIVIYNFASNFPMSVDTLCAPLILCTFCTLGNVQFRLHKFTSHSMITPKQPLRHQHNHRKSRAFQTGNGDRIE